MGDGALVLVPFAAEVLALERETFERALARGRELMPSPIPAEAAVAEEIATAEQMAKRTATPASWWLEAARKGTVPCLRIGKYPRFPVREALEALRATRPESAAPQAAASRSGVRVQPVTHRGPRAVTEAAKGLPIARA